MGGVLGTRQVPDHEIILCLGEGVCVQWMTGNLGVCLKKRKRLMRFTLESFSGGYIEAEIEKSKIKGKRIKTETVASV